jgi:hypothetical protein
MGERHLGDLKLKAGKSKTPDATGIDVRAPAPSRSRQIKRPPLLLAIGSGVLLFGLLLFGVLLLLRPFPEKPTPTPGFVRPSPSPNFLPSPSAETTPTPEPLPTPTRNPTLTRTLAFKLFDYAVGAPLLATWWWVVPAGLVLIWVAALVQRKLKGRHRETVHQGEAQASVLVSIGETRCLREETPGEGKLIVEDDLQAYAHLRCNFYRLEFSLTMLPDPDRSIERGELRLELVADPDQSKLPFFVRLHPEQVVVKEKKKLTTSGDGKATFKIPTVGEVGAEGKRESQTELEVESVTITSFGSGERRGGWRFLATDTRSINTSLTGLTALVAIPQGKKAHGRFRATAHLRSFKFLPGDVEPDSEAFIEYEFPPTFEVPSATAPVPDYA